MSAPRRSAAVILHRSTDRGLEVFLVERSAQLRHWGGHWAFPGGSVEPSDAPAPAQASGDPSSDEDVALACAARELLEEVGIDVAPDASRFRFACRLITPRFSQVRFDTSFFFVEAQEEPRVCAGELARGDWRLPAEALEDWRQGRMKIVAPVLDILDLLERHGLNEARRRLQAEPPEFERSTRSVRLMPGYEVVPVETPPLPPEIPVNVFLVGERRFVVIDPAPKRDRERDQIFAVIDRRLARGDEMLAVMLTHHHPDHVGALEATISRYPAPLWAHAITGELLGRKLDRTLADGDEIDLGMSPDGRNGWRLRALFTPGHAEGHLVFLDERHSALIAGDLVSTLVSMYVGSPGGNLQQYFASLERVQALGVESLLPSHGTPSRDPSKLIEETLRHRRTRIEEAQTFLTTEPQETEALALKIYPDGGGRLKPLIVRTTRAALEYLVEEGRAERSGRDAFRLQVGPGA